MNSKLNGKSITLELHTRHNTVLAFAAGTLHLLLKDLETKLSLQLYFLLNELICKSLGGTVPIVPSSVYSSVRRVVSRVRELVQYVACCKNLLGCRYPLRVRK